jgi:thymidylate kinase
MKRPFVVVSGVPGSGKTTLARRLSPALQLPLLDKDDILESLFDSEGWGDDERRHAQSRRSDEIFRQEAGHSNGAILVSFWHLDGMPVESGTPVTWIKALGGTIAHVHCRCDPEIAAERFRKRLRHPGHLDSETSAEELLERISQLARLPLPDFGEKIEIDTARDYDFETLVRRIRAILSAALA